MGGIPEVNSAGRIDQLEALRFEMKSKSPIYRVPKAGKFRKAKCLECERKFRKKKRALNTGARLGKLKSAPSGNTGILGEYISREFRVWIFGWLMICIYNGE